MKVKVIVPYYEKDLDRWFEKGEIINVEDKENSDFYHIWKGNKLYLIKKSNCEII